MALSCRICARAHACCPLTWRFPNSAGPRALGFLAPQRGRLPPAATPRSLIFASAISTFILEWTPRIERRRVFLSQFDRFQQSVEGSPAADPEFEQAYRLVTSPKAKQAFDLSDEKAAIRARYGPRTLGQSCLLARRLVERGVPFVSVVNTGWDTHEQLVLRLRDGYSGAQVGVGLIPTFDLAFAALVGDLKERGLLDETLVIAMGEFGRTPKLNTNGGRDHWPRVFSVVLAGGGVRGGQVIGASDRNGESPQDRPITPTDLARTIYTLLGIDPDHELHTDDGRPVPVNQGGALVRELLA
jgi:hypothetical protein